MSIGNYVFMCVVALFFIFKSTRVTALVLFASYMAYATVYYFIKDTIAWFLIVVVMNFLTGLVMLRMHHKVYTVVSVAYLCFLAVPFTFLGWVLYEYGYPGTINNNLGLVIMVSQVLAMTVRLLLDAGLLNYCLNCRVFRALNSYVNKCYNKIQGNKTQRKARKCQAK